MGFFNADRSKPVLRCPSLAIAIQLPFWPDDSSNTLPGWNRESLTRYGRRSLDVPSTKTTEERALGFTLRNEDYKATVAPMLEALRTMAGSTAPVQLIFGATATGLWSMEPPVITETGRADDGSPSVVDVSMVLKRASDAVVNVGPVKVAGGGSGFSRRR